MKKPKDINEYIAGFPEETQKILNQVRATIKKVAPRAEEKISYAIAAFTLNKMDLIYFAGYKNHIGLYPVPRGTEEFKKELSVFKGGKSTVQFPLDKPIPLRLITKIVKYRIKKNAEQAKAKTK